MFNYVLHLLTNLLLPFAIASHTAQQLLCYVRLLLKRLLYSRILPFGYNFIVWGDVLYPVGYNLKFLIMTENVFGNKKVTAKRRELVFSELMFLHFCYL